MGADKITHIWHTPDPDEVDEPGTILCAELHPWSPSQGGRIVFHLDSIIEGADYICTACGERTYRSALAVSQPKGGA